jgi:hypothetical protein
LYSAAWLNVSTEPLVLQVPQMTGGRYWLMQILDAWTNTCHDPGSANPQIGPGTAAPPYTYAITRSGWSGTLPGDVTQLTVPTDTVWVSGRIAVNGSDDVDAVRSLQARLKLAPLSTWGNGGGAAASGIAKAGRVTDMPPPKQVAGMDGRTFFNRLCALMATNPPALADGAAMQRFATLGIEPGGTVDKLDIKILDAAVAGGQRRISDYGHPRAGGHNGWTKTNVGTYGTDYLLRARVAEAGLGANLPRDALYLSTSDTAAANGTLRRFRLHFAEGQLPPVDAFWSLTAYDADHYLVPNPANIYAVGHQIPVVANDDGSVDIAVQNTNPGPSVPTGNWLPIPAAGTFHLILRLYAPGQQALNGHWQPPALTSVS